jgi:two-component system nitrogen regulation response regulator NtrX
VRELANIVERLSIMQPGAEVTAARVREVLQPTVSSQTAEIAPDWKSDAAPALAIALDEYERRIIQRAIASARGNIAEAARRLQTDRPNLYRRMKRLGIGSAQSDESA